LSPPLVINPSEIVASAEIISSVINRAQLLRPEFNPEESAKFNLPSTGTNYENQYILERRNKKLQSMGLNLNNGSNINVNVENVSKVNTPSNEFMNPIEQIQSQQKQQSNFDATLSQFAHVDSPFGTSPSNVLGLKLAENPNLEEKDIDIVFESEIKH
jgi:hypothetical protein